MKVTTTKFLSWFGKLLNSYENLIIGCDEPMSRDPSNSIMHCYEMWQINRYYLISSWTTVLITVGSISMKLNIYIHMAYLKKRGTLGDSDNADEMLVLAV